MKDYLGQELQVGDTIVYMQAGYKSFSKAEIKRFTAKKVVFDESPHEYAASYTTNRFPNEVIKVPK